MCAGVRRSALFAAKLLSYGRFNVSLPVEQREIIRPDYPLWGAKAHCFEWNAAVVCWKDGSLLEGGENVEEEYHVPLYPSIPRCSIRVAYGNTA